MFSTLWTTKQDLFVFVENRKIIGRKALRAARMPHCYNHPRLRTRHISFHPPGREGGDVGSRNQPSRPSHWAHTINQFAGAGM
jgi:hypothetical protein